MTTNKKLFTPVVAMITLSLVGMIGIVFAQQGSFVASNATDESHAAQEWFDNKYKGWFSMLNLLIEDPVERVLYLGTVSGAAQEKFMIGKINVSDLGLGKSVHLFVVETLNTKQTLIAAMDKNFEAFRVKEAYINTTINGKLLSATKGAVLYRR